MVSLANLPVELLLKLFPHDCRSLCRVSRVCRRFRQVAASDILWSQFFKNIPAQSMPVELKKLASRVYPLLGLVQGQYRETRIVGECLLTLRAFYHPATDRLLTFFEPHARSICLCQERNDSPDSEVAVGAAYDVGTKRRVCRIAGDHFERPSLPASVRFDQKGKEFIAVTESHICWNDFQTGDLKQKIWLKRACRVADVCYTDSRIGVGCNLIDLKNKKVLLTLPWPQSICAYDEKNRWLIAFFHDKLFIYKVSWKLSKRYANLIHEVADVAQPHLKTGSNLVYIPEWQRLFYTRGDKKAVMVLDLKSQDLRIMDFGNASVECLARTPTSLILSLLDEKRRYEVYDLATLGRTARFANEDSQPVVHMQHDPKTGVLLASSYSGMGFWDIASGACLNTISHPSKTLHQLEWDPAARTIAVYSYPYFQELRFRLIRY